MSCLPVMLQHLPQEYGWARYNPASIGIRYGHMQAGRAEDSYTVHTDGLLSIVIGCSGCKAFQGSSGLLKMKAQQTPEHSSGRSDATASTHAGTRGLKARSWQDKLSKVVAVHETS